MWFARRLLAARRKEGKSEGDELFRWWTAVYFCGSGLSGLIGGVVHAFYVDETTAGFHVLWPFVHLFLGMASFGTLPIGSFLVGHSDATIRRLQIVAIAGLVVYEMVVVGLIWKFYVAIMAYLPGTAWVCCAYAVFALRERCAKAWFGALAMAMLWLASATQIMRITVHPKYFTHNTLYHTIIMVHLVLLYAGADAVLSRKARSRRKDL